MPKKRKVQWNGLEYSSLSECARVLGIRKSALHKRLEQGYTCDDDVPDGRKIPVTWNGINYPSMKAAAEANKTTLATMSYRLKQGYTCDDDMAYIRNDE